MTRVVYPNLELGLWTPNNSASVNPVPANDLRFLFAGLRCCRE
jgi:hypothetical protein